MRGTANKKRLEKIEKAIMTEPEPEHEFTISVGLAEEYGGTGTKFFVDGKEVSRVVFESYPKDNTEFDVELVDDSD